MNTFKFRENLQVMSTSIVLCSKRCIVIILLRFILEYFYTSGICPAILIFLEKSNVLEMFLRTHTFFHHEQRRFTLFVSMIYWQKNHGDAFLGHLFITIFRDTSPTHLRELSCSRAPLSGLCPWLIS